MNYLVRSVEENKVIDVYTKATRNLIDADDVRNIVLDLVEKQNFNKIINIAYPKNYTIIEILEIFLSY